MTQEAVPTPRCSIVIATYNRCDSLVRTLECVLRQRDAPPYDVIVVDNDSTDDTATVVLQHLAAHPHLRYAFEGTRGQAAARNTGVSMSAAEWVVFTDDDIRPSDTWLAAMVGAAEPHPEIDCFGGRILPAWPSPPPAWLTREHWVGPLALQDYGDASVVIDRHHALSLASANMMWRRQAFLTLGGFSQECLIVEDTELLMRLWRSGGRSLYVPDAVVIADVQPERIGKRYHRQWHRRNGQWAARLALEESFDGRGGLRDEPAHALALFGIPSFMFRQLATTAAQWTSATLRRRKSRAFALEKALWQITSYMRTCASERPRVKRNAAAEISHFIGEVVRRKWSGLPQARTD
jgi:glycosyltransferase involved in cell wall biosynthesis